MDDPPEPPALDRWVASAIPDGLKNRLEGEGNAGVRLSMIDDALCPPEPQLLDTSVLQNLDWVDRKLEASDHSVSWDDESVGNLELRYGRELALDLLDLGTLYKQFEHYGSYPWVVCRAAVAEANASPGQKGDRLRDLVDFLAGHQEEWHGDSFPGIAKGLLLSDQGGRVSPLILRAMGVSQVGELIGGEGPLSFLTDEGDRSVVAQAILANIPVVLTTDRRTFWRHRDKVRELGVEILRPTELLDRYLPYWRALEFEYARRRAEAPPRR